MAVGDSYVLDVGALGFGQDLLRFCRSVDDDTMVGLRTDHDIGIVVVGTADNFVNANQIVLVVQRNRPLLSVGWLQQDDISSGV